MASEPEWVSRFSAVLGQYVAQRCIEEWLMGLARPVSPGVQRRRANGDGLTKYAMGVLVMEFIRAEGQRHQMENITKYLADKAAYMKQQREEKERSEVTFKKTLKQILKEAFGGTDRTNQEGVQGASAAAGSGGGTVPASIGAKLAALSAQQAAAGASWGMTMNPYQPGQPNPMQSGFIGPQPAYNLPGNLPGQLNPNSPLVPQLISGPFPYAPSPMPLRAGWVGEVAEREKPIEGWREYHLVFEHTAQGEDEVKIEGAGRRFMMSGRRAQALCEQASVDIDTVRRLLSDELLFNMWAERHFGEGGLAAICRNHLETDPTGCGCGFYGRNKEVSDYGAVVHARVSAFGVVACDDKGNWRASDIELEELLVYVRNVNVSGLTGLENWLDWQRICDLLRDRYAVPVKLVR